MHRAWLDDSAARRGQPPEPLTPAAAAGRPFAGTCGPYRVDGGADAVHVHLGIERPQPGSVDGGRRGEVVERLTVDDDADVDGLAPFDPRDGPQDGVLEGLHGLASGSQDREAAARAARYSTYAARPSAGSQSCGTSATTSVSSASLTNGASSASADPSALAYGASAWSPNGYGRDANW